MKTKQLIFALTAALFMGFTACTPNDEPNNGNGNENGNENVGGGNEGGGDETTLEASLKGSDYYVFALDGITYEKIADKVTADCRPNPGNVELYVWDNTYIAGTSTGPNFYSEVEAWTSLQVGTIGWSGLGICAVAPTGDGTGTTVDLTGITPEHTLHIAMRSKDSASHLLSLGDGNATVGVAIGATNFIDGATTYVPVTDFARDGEWHEIEIPMSTFFDHGLNYRDAAQTGNMVTFLSGGVAGTTLDFDALFIYKK